MYGRPRPVRGQLGQVVDGARADGDGHRVAGASAASSSSTRSRSAWTVGGNRNGSATSWPGLPKPIVHGAPGDLEGGRVGHDDGRPVPKARSNRATVSPRMPLPMLSRRVSVAAASARSPAPGHQRPVICRPGHDYLLRHVSLGHAPSLSSVDASGVYALRQAMDACGVARSPARCSTAHDLSLSMEAAAQHRRRGRERDPVRSSWRAW